MKNSVITLEIIQHIDKLNVTNVMLTAEPGRLVNNRTACNIAANRLNKLIGVIRTAKRAGASVGYRMNLITTVKIWNGSNLVLDTNEVAELMAEYGAENSFTFRGVTSCDKKRANIVHALLTMAELQSLDA